MTDDLATLRAEYLYRYGDTHPVCALVDRVQAAEAALAACEDTKRIDWLVSHRNTSIVNGAHGVGIYRDSLYGAPSTQLGWSPKSLREAIDAAIAAEPNARRAPLP